MILTLLAALDIIFLTKCWALCFILVISTSTSANCIMMTGRELHHDDGKGTYERKSKKQILVSVIDRSC